MVLFAIILPLNHLAARLTKPEEVRAALPTKASSECPSEIRHLRAAAPTTLSLWPSLEQCEALSSYKSPQ